MMDSFYNPYHFIPFGDVSKVKTYPVEPSEQADHSTYAPKTYSGRMILKISNPKTPLFVGNRRTEASREKPAESFHYAPGKTDAAHPADPAIPGSALRGCLGSLIEAASGSAMRILDDRSVPGSDLGFYEFLHASVGDNLEPMSADRTKITPAEGLLGFVDVQRSDQGTHESGRALAGRLRLNDAILGDRPDRLYMDSVVLRILNTPKARYPWFYYFDKGGHPLNDSFPNLDPKWHQPLGRKYYLHPQCPGEEHWTANSNWERDARQYTCIRPLAPKCLFHTHIDFDNLSPVELGLLLYSLDPADNFVHRLGMAKPLGLGCARIDMLGLRFVERSSRYSVAGFLAPRYGSGWTADGEDPTKWPAVYREPKPVPSTIPLRKALNTARALVDRDIHQAIKLMGNPDSTSKCPVHAPTRRRQGHDAQSRTYEWFSTNRNSTRRQRLKPLSEDSTELPALDMN
jgi:hypothetical protein